MSDLFSDVAPPVAPKAAVEVAAPVRFDSNSCAGYASHVVRFNPYPWKLPLAEYKALECELECTTKLVKLAEKLTERLSDGVKYGHCAAYLYGTWAKRIGRPAVLQYWLDYDAYAANLAAAEQYSAPADDADYDDIPF